LFKVRFSDINFGSFVAVYGKGGSVIDVWITGPRRGEPRHEQFVPENLGGPNWASGVIKFHPQNRGDEYTIRVKTTGDAFVFTSHDMAAK